MSSSRAQLAQAISCQRQGRLSEAVTIYRQLIASEPRNSDVLHQYGIAMAQMGRIQEAAGLISAAVEIQPANPAMRVNLGKALGDLGRHAEAVSSYERAVSLNPTLAAAHRGRGNALLRMGRPADALASLQEAVRLAPDAHGYCDMGVALELLGRNEEALKCFDEAIELNPSHAEAYHNRSLMQTSLGRHDEALASIDRTLALLPQQPEVHANRGNTLRALRRFEDALSSYDRSLAIRPGDAITHHNRGLTLMELERHVEALASFDRALALAPAAVPTHVCRGAVCLQLQRPAEALGSFDRAMALDPAKFEPHLYRGIALALLDRHEESLHSLERALAINQHSVEALNNSGVALGRLSRPDEALQRFAQAQVCDPDHVQSYTNAGNTQKGLKRYQEALSSFDRALSIKPTDAMTLWSKALLKLTRGELREGWPLYESRFDLTHLRSTQRPIDMPRWSGEQSLQNKSIFVYAEQGIGDTLQFARYVPLLEARGARVVFEVQPVLKPLLDSFEMAGELRSSAQPVPQCDFCCPLLSLPLGFKTELDTIPGGVPYVKVAAAAVHAWTQRLAQLPGIRIGLNWQGNVEAEKQAWVRGRSFALTAAAPLARLPGVSWVSLQKGTAAEQRHQADFGDRLAQLTDPADTGANELLNTAALMMSLDLVITSDTSVAHLAGALGVPVWLALHADPDWRWLTERADSPWYPTMRLFRQVSPGDWSSVFETMAAELATLRQGRDDA